MSGRILVLALVALAVLAGAGVWYAQNYAYYRRVPEAAIRLTPAEGGAPEAIGTRGMRAIDAASSPIRFRACFRVPDPAALSGRFAPAPEATPLNAPFWFSCFDAEAIGAALAEGRARAYLGVREIRPGVDRIVAVFDDGRGYAWQQLNGTLEN